MSDFQKYLDLYLSNIKLDNDAADDADDDLRNADHFRRIRAPYRRGAARGADDHRSLLKKQVLLRRILAILRMVLPSRLLIL